MRRYKNLPMPQLDQSTTHRRDLNGIVALLGVFGLQVSSEKLAWGLFCVCTDRPERATF